MTVVFSDFYILKTKQINVARRENAPPTDVTVRSDNRVVRHLHAWNIFLSHLCTVHLALGEWELRRKKKGNVSELSEKVVKMSSVYSVCARWLANCGLLFKSWQLVWRLCECTRKNSFFFLQRKMTNKNDETQYSKSRCSWLYYREIISPQSNRMLTSREMHHDLLSATGWPVQLEREINDNDIRTGINSSTG